MKVSDVCLKKHLDLHLQMLVCSTQILTRLRKPDLLWDDDEDCHDDIYTGYPKKTHFLNCRFAKPGLRVCGLPLPVKQPTVEGHVRRKSKRSVEAPRQGVIEVKQMKIKFWIWNPQKYKRNPIYVYEVCVCCKKMICMYMMDKYDIYCEKVSVCLSVTFYPHFLEWSVFWVERREGKQDVEKTHKCIHLADFSAAFF